MSWYGARISLEFLLPRSSGDRGKARRHVRCLWTRCGLYCTIESKLLELKRICISCRHDTAANPRSISSSGAAPLSSLSSSSSASSSTALRRPKAMLHKSVPLTRVSSARRAMEQSNSAGSAAISTSSTASALPSSSLAGMEEARALVAQQSAALVPQSAIAVDDPDLVKRSQLPEALASTLNHIIGQVLEC